MHSNEPGNLQEMRANVIAIAAASRAFNPMGVALSRRNGPETEPDFAAACRGMPWKRAALESLPPSAMNSAPTAAIGRLSVQEQAWRDTAVYRRTLARRFARRSRSRCGGRDDAEGFRAEARGACRIDVRRRA